MSTVAAATEAAEYRRFKDRPSQVFIDHVSDHIDRTGQPETHIGLFRGRLDRAEPFLRLKKINIDTRLRPEGDRAPCPRCHSPNKFKDGWLVYLTERGAAAVVGIECATGEAQAAADREWEAREQRRNDENYLLEVVPKLPQWLSQIDRLLIVAEPVAEFASKLRGEGKEYFERLRNARSRDGRLSVTQVLKGDREGPRGLRTTGSTYETAEHHVGTLMGRSLINPALAPTRGLREVANAIRAFACDDDDAAFHFVADMEDGQRNKAAAELKAAAGRARSIAGELEDCRLFLSDENLGALDAWGQHPYADFRFSAKLLSPEQSGHRRFEFRGKPYFYHRVPPEFWAEIGEFRLDGEQA